MANSSHLYHPDHHQEPSGQCDPKARDETITTTTEAEEDRMGDVDVEASVI